MVTKKVVITGTFGVGKTSLFNRFIHQQFSDKYITTIGVKVNNKVIDLEGEQVSMMLWDIAGEPTQEKTPATYFLGASGIIYVMDLSRPSTFNNLETDINLLRQIAPKCAIVIVGNKKDLLSSEQLEEAQNAISMGIDYKTSAKTGENVEQLFYKMAERLIISINVL